MVHLPVIGAHGLTGGLWEQLRWHGKAAVKQVVLPITRLLMKMGFRRLPWKIDHYRLFSFVKLERYLRRVGFADVELRILPWDEGHSYVLARKPNAARVQRPGAPHGLRDPLTSGALGTSGGPA
jgi:hypothetical protein